MLQELAIDAFVNRNGRAVSINHEDGNAGFVSGNTGNKRFGSK